jgi:uncharacterized membrane protein
MAAPLSRLAGVALAGVGLSHFVKPELFQSMTVSAFPTNTQQYIYVNGVLETAIGLAYATGRSKLGTAGLLAYGGWLGANAAKNA